MSTGNAGEHLVMAELLVRGFDAFLADRANPAFDIACVAKETRRATRLRVKTTANGEAVWTVKKTGVFLDFLKEAMDDFVIICDIRRGIRGADIYVVPTTVVEQDIILDHAAYIAHPGKRGQARKDSALRVMRFFGEPRSENQAYGYQDKYGQYRDAWDLLR
jgi:hypothetical protein